METRSSAIHIDVSLDKEHVPEGIEWSASDLEEARPQEAKAMLLAFFDRKSNDTLKIDLWTKDMQVGEMDRFMFQTIRSLAETYRRATSNHPLAEAMQEFALHFGREAKLLNPDGD
jgi:gliding motility-associated protein GldC